jgi:hypothetical protein
MEQQKNEVLPETLNLMVLKTLSTHGLLKKRPGGVRLKSCSGFLNHRRKTYDLVTSLHPSLARVVTEEKA